jgi:ribonuclease HI
VLTDSDYVRRSITEFLPRWKENGWRNSAGKPVANQDLWEQLEELAQYHDVNWYMCGDIPANRNKTVATHWRQLLQER